MGWVAGKDDDSWGYREMSRSAHVQADGRTVVWTESCVPQLRVDIVGART
jgi:hypothetical protein